MAESHVYIQKNVLFAKLYWSKSTLHSSTETLLWSSSFEGNKKKTGLHIVQNLFRILHNR